MNKTKTSLFLMELIIVIFFFALTGAVCMQVFVNAHIFDRKTNELNEAVRWAENVGECFHEFGSDTETLTETLIGDGDFEISDGTYKVYLDKGFEIAPVASADIAYCILLTPSEDDEFDYFAYSMTYIQDNYTIYDFTYKLSKKEVR